MNKTKKVLFVGLCSTWLLLSSSCFINKFSIQGVINLFFPPKDFTLPPRVFEEQTQAPGDSPQIPPLQPTQTIKVPTVPPEPRLCVAYKEDIAWGYEDLNTSSGTGGTTCSAELTMRNNSNERLVFELYTLFDNGYGETANWKGYPVEPGEKTSVQVSKANYKDGTITYNKVQYILAVRDVPECWFFLTDEAKKGLSYGLLAVQVEEMPCP